MLGVVVCEGVSACFFQRAWTACSLSAASSEVLKALQAEGEGLYLRRSGRWGWCCSVWTGILVSISVSF